MLISAGILALIILSIVPWPFATRTTATAYLHQITTNELQPLVPATNALMQGAKPTVISECDEMSHSLTQTHLFCRDMYWYKLNTSPLPPSSRANVIAEATALDKALQQNGWQPDRPQDEAHSVAAAIPTSPLAVSHTVQVPFHKNVDAISCNLSVEFDGPTDGTSPGAIIINRFSCQQDISYFAPHTSNYINKDFGP